MILHASRCKCTSINAKFLDFTWHSTILTLKDCGKLRMHIYTEEQWEKKTSKKYRQRFKKYI